MKKTVAIIALLLLSLNTMAFAQTPTIIEIDGNTQESQENEENVEENVEKVEEIDFPEVIDIREDGIVEETITPESDLYPIKRLFEELQGYFYSLDTQKVDYYVNLAEKRLDELDSIENHEEKMSYIESVVEDFLAFMAISEEIAENIETEQEGTEVDQDDEIDNISEGEEESEDIDNDGDSEDLDLEEEDEEQIIEEKTSIEQKLEKAMSHHQWLMEKFEAKLLTAPAPARKGLGNAMANIQRGHDRKIQKLLLKAGITIEEFIGEIDDEIIDNSTEGELVITEEENDFSNETIEQKKEKNNNNGSNNNKNNKNDKNNNGANNSSPNSRHNR